MFPEHDTGADPDFLVESYLEETLSEDQAALLLRHLKENPALAKRLYESTQLDHFLYSAVGGQRASADFVRMILEYQSAQQEEANARPAPEKKAEKERKKKPRPWKWVLPVLLIGIFSICFLYEGASRRSAPRNRTVFHAKIVDVVDVESNETLTLKRNTRLAEEPVRLLSGTIGLKLKNGTDLVVEGPAEFALVDGATVDCRSGKISATIDGKSASLTIRTPQGTVIDRGTRFFLDVGRQTAQVHVLSGKVDFQNDTDKPVQLLEGNALNISDENHLKLIPADSKLFFTMERLLRSGRQSRKIRREAFEKQYTEILADPSLLAAFDLSGSQSGTVGNQAKSGRLRLASGRLFGGTITEGRYVEDGAVRFQSDLDRFEFNFRDECSSLTLYMALCPDRLNHSVNRLLASRQFHQESGNGLWQITGTGSVQFHLRYPRDVGSVVFETGPIVTENQWGTWVSLAVVLDAESKTVRHYKDGLPIASAPWSNPIPIRLGETMLSGEFQGKRQSIPQFLDGAVSHLMIFNRALSSDEIVRMEGKPVESVKQ